jgi:hypothetical protein
MPLKKTPATSHPHHSHAFANKLTCEYIQEVLPRLSEGVTAGVGSIPLILNHAFKPRMVLWVKGIAFRSGTGAAATSGYTSGDRITVAAAAGGGWSDLLVAGFHV